MVPVHGLRESYEPLKSYIVDSPTGNDIPRKGKEDYGYRERNFDPVAYRKPLELVPQRGLKSDSLIYRGRNHICGSHEHTESPMVAMIKESTVRDAGLSGLRTLDLARELGLITPSQIRDLDSVVPGSRARLNEDLYAVENEYDLAA